MHVDASPASTTYGQSDPTPTDTLRSADLLKFVRALGYEPSVIRLP